MADEVGLRAILKPEIDRSEARTQARSLKDVFEDEDYSITPSVDTSGVQATLRRELSSQVGRALPGPAGRIARRTLRPSRGGGGGGGGLNPGGVGGMTASEPETIPKTLTAQLEVQEEILELLEASDLGDGRGEGNLLRRFITGGGILAGGAILGSELMDFLEDFRFVPPEIPDIPDISIRAPFPIPIPIEFPDWLPGLGGGRPSPGPAPGPGPAPSPSPGPQPQPSPGPGPGPSPQPGGRPSPGPRRTPGPDPFAFPYGTPSPTGPGPTAPRPAPTPTGPGSPSPTGPGAPAPTMPPLRVPGFVPSGQGQPMRTPGPNSFGLLGTALGMGAVSNAQTAGRLGGQGAQFAQENPKETLVLLTALGAAGGLAIGTPGVPDEAAVLGAAGIGAGSLGAIAAGQNRAREENRRDQNITVEANPQINFPVEDLRRLVEEAVRRQVEQQFNNLSNQIARNIL